MNKKVITLIVCLLVAGCGAKTGHQFLEKMSNQEIASKLIAKKTSKAEVKEMFGSPEDIDMTDDGGETWLYKYVRSEAKGINYVPIASSFMVEPMII